ncbi:MAG: ABC transporter permease, partial [Chloroflexota bacterium]
METLFGIPMDTMAVSVAVALAVAAAFLGFLALRNRLLVKMGLRNIPRRRAQTVLIVLGLMLSTVIISASLSIGDTVTSSIRNVALGGIGESDLRVRTVSASGQDLEPGGNPSAFLGDTYMGQDRVESVLSAVEGDDRVDGVLPQIREVLPVLNTRTQLTEARMNVAGFDPTRQDGFGDIETVDGEPIRLSDLAPGEVLINEQATGEIEARAGDEVVIVTPQGRNQLTVRAVVKEGGLAANDNRTVTTLATMQELMDRQGMVNRIDISLESSTAAISAQVTDELRLRFTDAAAAQQLFDALQSDGAIPALKAYREAQTGQTLQGADLEDFNELIDELIDELEAGPSGVSDEFRVLAADRRISGHAAAALETAGMTALAGQVVTLSAQTQVLAIDELRQNALEVADTVGNIFVTIFTIFGSFSIIVGLLLVFLVFIMLAASRSTEMGIARAIGMKRRHLVQMFSFEGSGYALAAAIVGTVIGGAAASVLVRFMARAIGTSDDLPGFSFTWAFTPASIVTGFSAGLIITLVTVGVAAYRASRLNIVVAIRDLPQQFVPRGSGPLRLRLLRLLQALLGPLYHLYRAVTAPRRREGAFLPLVLTLLDLLVIPWVIGILVAIFRLFEPYLAQGWPLALLGAGVAASGIQAAQQFPFALGSSVFLVGLALLARTLLHRTAIREERADRLAFTLMGVSLLVFWALPFGALEWLTGELSGGIEMFVLSGVWMVAAAVWVVMYNADLLANVLQAAFGRGRFLRPVLKPAVAYPMSARFRTGLTLAMFALVIFTMMVFAILNNIGSDIDQNPDRVTGGFDVRAETTPDLAIDDMRGGIEDAENLDISDFRVIAGHAVFPAEARQTGSDERRFRPLQIRAASPTYLAETRLDITHFDPSYIPDGTPLDDTRAVSDAIWQALEENPELAVIPASMAPSAQQQQGFGPGPSSNFRVEGITAGSEDRTFEAVDVEIRRPGQPEQTATRTVIGVIDVLAEAYETGVEGGPQSGGPEFTTRDDISTQLYGQAVPYTTYRIRLAEGADPDRVAAALETAFLDNSLRATDTMEEIQRGIAQNNAFGDLFQAFMGLGLVVGVAALGVLSFRAVVERRHAIGMMRAIGYRARMIQVQFLMESAFVTLLGSALGVG